MRKTNTTNETGTQSADGEGEKSDEGLSEQPSADADDAVRVTMVEILINTNTTDSIGGGYVDELAEYLEGRLFKAETLQHLIPTLSNNADDLLRLEVRAPAIEIGLRRGMIHAHFILRIIHATQVLVGAMAGEFQQHVRSHSIFGGAFVSVRLIDTRAENYALKEVTRESFLRTMVKE